VLAGRYRLLDLLGSGGMASVHLAEHITLGKRIAIKILDEDLCRDREHIDRFLQEARAASMIGHENIVDIIDFGPAPNGSVFYAMEHLEGETIAALLRREGRIPWARARTIMIQIARALSAAHGKGVIHRDLKPANCFMVRRADGRPFVKVLDFGIARVMVPDDRDGPALTRPGSVFGTAKYMAPEQACGARADARTDIYAAAVCLYEMLTGSVPYDGDSFLRVLNKHITEPLMAPTTRAPDAGISPFVEAVIVKALAKRPEDRYASMAELEAALSAIELDGSLVAPRDPGPPLVGPGVARPSGSGPTGTIWLGPPRRGVPTRRPTIRLAPPQPVVESDATCCIPGMGSTQPAPPRPRPPSVPELPPTRMHVDATHTTRSSFQLVIALIAATLLAVAAGVSVAWLVIDRLGETDEPLVTRDERAPEQPAVGALPEHASPPAPIEPAHPSVDVEDLPAPVLVPAEPTPPETASSKPRRRHAARSRTAVNIARGFTRAHDRVRACLDEDSSARIHVHATVGTSGKVMHVDVVGAPDPELASCIRQAVKAKARFARAEQALDELSWTFAP
jgi:serine/threonine protein kinase